MSAEIAIARPAGEQFDGLAPGGGARRTGEASLRVLFAGERWPGSDAYAYERAFRRAGHAVTAIESANYLPTGWRSPWLKAVRRALTPLLIAEYEKALIDMARSLRPQLFVGFKAPFVTARAMREIKDGGAICINIYPDVSVMAHGPRLPQALPMYDWVFTTKSFGLGDMERQLGITDASFVPPAYDPEHHHPLELTEADVAQFGNDVSFIGTWSPKKERLLAALARALPDARIRIWGGNWQNAAAPELSDAIAHRTVIGPEYTKAVCASRINLAILSEQVAGASSGDLITHRTFAIPACGGFMLHERTSEVGDFFEEDGECALFGSENELIEKVRHYLSNEAERARIAAAGRERAVAAGYSVDARVRDVTDKFGELSGASGRPISGPPTGSNP